MSDVRFWVKRYLDEGWSPIPIPSGEKGPRVSGWESKTFAVSDFSDTDNIGVHLGKTGLYDVDLDDKMAAIAADILLPNTARVSGRPGKPRSHRFFTSDERIEHAVYHGLGGNNDTIVELRGWSKSGAPTQTVIPPSVHPSGELVTWDSDQKPLHCQLPEQTAFWKCGVRNVAIAVLLARAFPGPGHRHGPRLAMAGFLHRAGLEDREVLAIGKAVMTLIGGDVNDWLDTAKTTLAKLKGDKGAAITGGPTLKNDLADGELVLKRLNLWLGRKDEAAVDDVIDGLNRHHFILEAGTQVVVGDDSQDAGIKLWPFAEFKKKYCKDFMPGQRTPDKTSKSGVVTPGKYKKGRPIVDVWIEHPRGRKCEQLVYAPPGSTVKVGPKDYNGWKGFRIDPAPGQWPLIHDHLRDVICGGDVDVFEWVLNWIAALIQKPGEHATTALVLRGGQGVGKGFFAHDLLGKLFDQRHYVHMVDRQQFYGRFNDVLSGRCLVFLDEATWGGDKQDAGILKGRVTNDDLIIERKHLAVLTERSMLHIILASNEEWPVGVDRDDRRFVALDVTGAHANDPSYFRPLYEELANGGHAAFLHDMLQWVIDAKKLRAPCNTKGKDELKERSMSPVAEWWHDRLIEGKLLTTDVRWEPQCIRASLHAEYSTAMQAMGISRRLSSQAFGRMLKKMCPLVETIRPKASGPRCYVFPSLRLARSTFQEFVGSAQQWDSEGDSATLVPDDGQPF